MRKDQNLRMYGRHKTRVIVSDVWLSESDKKQSGVFSTSSDDSSRHASIFHSSSSSESSTGSSDHSLFTSQTSNIQTRSTRKSRQTENKENEHSHRQTRKRDTTKKQPSKNQKQVWALSSSTDSSLVSENIQKARALRDRNHKIDYNDSASLKKQKQGATGKRKRTCNVTKPCKETSVNFSDFDSYCLLISDSPSVDIVKANDKLASMETSTPVAKRTRCKDASADNMKLTNISHIEMIQSPSSDVGDTTVNTPESIHSQSSFNTPSVLSSNCSKDALDWSRKTGKTGNVKTSVQLQRIQKSFFLAISSGTKPSLVESQTRKLPGATHVFNNSDSLFSTPNGTVERNISLLTERLKQVRCAQLYNNDSLREEGEDSTDVVDKSNVIEQDIENGDEIEEESDNIDKDEPNEGDLSAIDEDGEVTEDETEDEEDDDEDECTDLESESENNFSATHCDSEHSGINESGSIQMTINLRKKPIENLQRLSESLLNNHVNRRRTTNSARAMQMGSEVESLSECLYKSHIDSSGSNCTLYMLNEDKNAYSRQSGSVDLSTQEEENSEAGSESTDESKSTYDTAQSSRQSEGEYHTADDYHNVDEDDDDDDDDSNTDKEETSANDKKAEAKPQTPIRRKYSLREKFHDDLQNSFSEILTPSRRSRLVPMLACARVLILCDQTEPVTFKTALPNKMICECKKIGEGVYGEVFRSYNATGDAVAIKVIPIEGDFEVNDEVQKKFSEILPEIVIAKELSQLRSSTFNMTSNFCQVNNVSCIKGRYPSELVKQWDIYHKTKGSENDRPDVFPEDQLYIVLEFADCGSDLETYKFDNIKQGKSVLTQVAYALAVAEESLQFEHRDLHWGNILVRQTDKEDICFKLLGNRVSVPSLGVEASVIDFTMSRLSKDGCTVYISFADEDTLFQGKGDYQFDIYRAMKLENQSNWEKFCPYTNVLWLHYLADKIVYSTRYPSASSRSEREGLREVRQFMSTILDFHSALDMSVGSLFLNS